MYGVITPPVLLLLTVTIRFAASYLFVTTRPDGYVSPVRYRIVTVA